MKFSLSHLTVLALVASLALVCGCDEAGQSVADTSRAFSAAEGAPSTDTSDTAQVPAPGATAPGGEATTDRSKPKWAPELVDLAGEKYAPFAGTETRAVALVFVLQDCPIANSYMPELNRLGEKFAARGIPLFVIQTDPEISPEAARQHTEEYQLKVPVVLDQEHRWVQLAKATRTPEVVVFSPAEEVLYRGRIDDRYVGYGKRRTAATVHDLEDALAAIVAGREVAVKETEAIGCYIPEAPSP